MIRKDKRKQEKRTTKGITLIALVVTIVVLLILAGVSINAVLGDSGIIAQAKKAADAAKEGAKQDERSIKDITDELNTILSGGEAIQVTDKMPGELEGKGTEKDPYLIESIEDLVSFSNKVNEGETYEGKTVKLGINLDFQSELSYVNYQSNNKDINENNKTEDLKTELTTGGGFIPIGNADHQFNGNFDGGNHTIKNLYIKEEKNNCVGLFGNCGNKSNIKNIVMSNASIISTKNLVGGLTGINYGTIDKVKTQSGEITAKGFVGGIVGQNVGGIITSSSNGANVKENETQDTGTKIDVCIGGIVGDNRNNRNNKRMF